MNLTNIYSSAGCNRKPGCVDWGFNEYILFAACNSIAIAESQKDEGVCRILHTYASHTKRVNSVRWVQLYDGNSKSQFVSGSDDGLVIFWDISSDLKNPKNMVLKGHTDAVTVVDAIHHNNATIIASASSESYIKLWENKNDGFLCVQDIDLNGGFCFALRLTSLPESEGILLACGGDTNRIILLAAGTDKYFYKKHQLVGHEDWIRGLDFIRLNGGDIFLASSSQDTSIRIWKIRKSTSQMIKDCKILNASMTVNQSLFAVVNDNDAVPYSASLESVLRGHDGWVYSVHWNSSDELYLLSSSIDKSIIVWCQNEGVWMEKVRLGDVGGNSSGFFGAQFSNSAKSILAHGFQGSFHLWNQTTNNYTWLPNTVIGGHFGEVRDIAWDPLGRFLFSISSDQTTRIHAEWVQNKGNKNTWHEIARPQIHGYDLQSIAVLSSHKFASGAEEKIVRVFEAPSNFVQNSRTLLNILGDTEDDIFQSMPRGAFIPSLGLSNKAMFDSNKGNKNNGKSSRDDIQDQYFESALVNSPPHEGILMQDTLWPEIQKLYGHGFEIFALATSNNGKILASSAKAAISEHAEIILWDTTSWKKIQQLYGHKLTVTQMTFSPNDRLLLSVSRDRDWRLFENKSDEESPCFEMCLNTVTQSHQHSRVIWACDWSHDSKNFVTTSRDGKAIAWSRSENCGSRQNHENWRAMVVFELKRQSITAVSFAHNYLIPNAKKYLIALGLESGTIILCSLYPWVTLIHLDNNVAHHLTVKQLSFRPNIQEFHLATCGNDHLVKIFNIDIDKSFIEKHVNETYIQ